MKYQLDHSSLKKVRQGVGRQPPFLGDFLETLTLGDRAKRKPPEVAPSPDNFAAQAHEEIEGGLQP